MTEFEYIEQVEEDFGIYCYLYTKKTVRAYPWIIFDLVRTINSL